MRKRRFNQVSDDEDEDDEELEPRRRRTAADCGGVSGRGDDKRGTKKMRKRRFNQVSDDEDEDDEELEPRRRRTAADCGGVSGRGDDKRGTKKKPRVDDEDDDEAEEPPTTTVKKRGRGRPRGSSGRRIEEQLLKDVDGEKEEKEPGEGKEEMKEEEELEAKPIGEAIKVSMKGKQKRLHYSAFEYDGNVFELEDSVLLTPVEFDTTKPYVAIIKEITQTAKGSMKVTGQWFYRPEEAEKKGGGNWESRDARELFYSFHLDEVPAESVMHKCVVHFVPLNKKWPIRSQHPGFIVQRVYDVSEKMLWKLTDKDYEDGKQRQLDILVQKTRDRIGELPDVEPEVAPRKNQLPPIRVSRADDTSATMRSDFSSKVDTPGSCSSNDSVYKAILGKLDALTGDSYRDKWLEKLLQGIKSTLGSKKDDPMEDKRADTEVSKKILDSNIELGTSTGSKSDTLNDGESSLWPDAAVKAITALERAANENLSSDFQKYNQKMRQLFFNIKSNSQLAMRLLNKELDPANVVNMSPNELKEGLTAEERTCNEPEETTQLQMTDARCTRCLEKRVGIAEIIQAGGKGDRYQLECVACGHTWYASQDAVASLTIDAPNAAINVGTAPWATAKFEVVEKTLVSPRESEKPPSDILQKSAEAYMPVLETQKSFNKPKSDDHTVLVATRE